MIENILFFLLPRVCEIRVTCVTRVTIGSNTRADRLVKPRNISYFLQGLPLIKGRIKIELQDN